VEGEAASARSGTDSEFEVRLPLAKTWRDDEGGLWVEGVASSTCVDRQSERMSVAAIERMSMSAGLRLLPNHRAAPVRGLGAIEECWADNDEFRVRGRLDESNPEARRLYERLKRGRRYGLSVGGRVRAAHWECDPVSERKVRVIDEVALDHIALCKLSEAANPNTYLSVMGRAAGALGGGDPSDDEATASTEAPQCVCVATGGEAAPPRAGGLDVVSSMGRFLAGLASVLRPPMVNGTADPDGRPGAETELSGRLDELCQEVSALMREVEGLGDMVGKSVVACPRPEAPRTIGVQRSLAGQERTMAREGHIWKGVL
jgi:HK97 family phage prohead protease